MSGTDLSTTADDVRPGYEKRWWVLATMTVCLLVVIMGNTILNVALPTLQRDLGATQGELQWAVDARLPHTAVTADEIDRILGAVLSYADDHFNAMLEIGFGTSIRREWDWRVKRGESLRNLEAFAAFADPSAREARSPAESQE